MGESAFSYSAKADGNYEFSKGTALQGGRLFIFAAL
jgi:hypothetical protein